MEYDANAIFKFSQVHRFKMMAPFFDHLKRRSYLRQFNSTLAITRWKSIDLNQKRLHFVSKSQIALLLSLDSLKFSFKNIILFSFLGLNSLCPPSWFKGQPAYRYVLERSYQGRKQNIKEAYRESFYCAGSLSLFVLA